MEHIKGKINDNIIARGGIVTIELTMKILRHLCEFHFLHNV